MGPLEPTADSSIEPDAVHADGFTETARPRHPIGERPGDRIGPYKLLEQIGEGGFGVVFVAEQLEPVRRRVALKVIKAGMDTRDVIARFEAERQALAMMDHPNVAHVYDAGATDRGRPYFVMEFVPGVRITDHCDRHRLDIRQRLELFQQVCHGVQHAHQKGIIHRDLKPSNILVSLHETQAIPKIIDFGVAKAAAGRLTDKTIYTERGQWIGTPAYMSPEQAEMTAQDIDTRSDIYSLGVVLYELLTGAVPFEHDSLRQAGFGELQRILRQVEPPRPSYRVSTLRHTWSEQAATITAGTAPRETGSPRPEARGYDIERIADQRQTDPATLRKLLRGDLDWIIMRAMEKDRTRRYASASDLAADVARHLHHEPVLAGPPSTTYRVRKFVRRNRPAVIGAASIFLALLMGVVASTLLYLRAERLRSVAARERDRAVSAEAEAKSRRDQAEAVTGFLSGMLVAAEPAEALGRDFTVKEMLGQAAKKIDTSLRNQPLVEATLRLTIGNAYRALGKYDDAEPHLRAALELRRKRLGEEHLEVADAMTDLAALLDARGDYATAEPLFRGALRIRRKQLGEEHELVAESLTNVGILLFRRGDFVAAEPVWRETLAMQRKLLGNEHAMVADSLSNLGAVLRNKGDIAAAEQLYREALAMRRRTLREGHPWVAESLINLGLLLRDKGDYEEAEPLWREALAIRRKVFGNEHTEVAQSLRHLAIVLLDKGDLPAAESTVREALAMERKLLGDEHVDTAHSGTVLGQVLLAKGEAPAAESELRRSLAIFRVALPASHWSIAHAESLLGGCLTAEGRYKEAEPLLLGAEPTLRRVRGGRDRHAVDALKRIVALYQSWGKSEKASQFQAMIDTAQPGS